MNYQDLKSLEPPELLRLVKLQIGFAESLVRSTSFLAHRDIPGYQPKSKCLLEVGDFRIHARFGEPELWDATRQELQSLLLHWRQCERNQSNCVLTACHPSVIKTAKEEVDLAIKKLREFVDSEPWSKL